MAMVYAATADDAKGGRLGWRRTWKRANPSLDVLSSLEVALRAEWKEAQGDDQAMARFKSLRLNMGTAEDGGKPLGVSGGVGSVRGGHPPARVRWVCARDRSRLRGGNVRSLRLLAGDASP